MQEVTIIVICLILNALFAAYEMAFVSVPRPELRGHARKGSKAAERLIGLRENPERTLSIIQIGITLVGAVAAAVGGGGAAEILEPYFIKEYRMSTVMAEIISITIVVLPITYLSVVVGELVPKTLALRSPLKIVIAGAKPLFIADKILSPLVSLLEGSTKVILKTFFKQSKKVEDSSLQTTIEIDSFTPTHQSFMINMAEIGKKKIKHILIPWEEVNHTKKTSSIEEVHQMVLNSGHTRLPVLDNGNVIGILHTKEFLILKESGETNWPTIIRPALKALPTDGALSILRVMQEKRNHMTVVVSPKGELLGIVTLEDIFEEVIGDIADEDDDGKIRKIFANRIRNRERGRA